MNVLTVVGARPQFIKAAAVSRAFKECRQDINEILVHTGQHYDFNMSDVFFSELNISRPDYNLGIGGGTHGQNTGRMLEKIEELLFEIKPDYVLVYGDTDSTFAGALAAAKLNIPVVHVEAGLRSFNRCMPEEVNRVLTDHVSTLLFAPSELAKNNLLQEGICIDKIKIVGDVMYDVALYYKHLACKPLWFDSLSVVENDFVLCTIHRAENTDDSDRLMSIFDGLGRSGSQIILPLHPRTKKCLAAFDIEISNNINIVDPVGYLEMVWLEANCRLIATDSGGVQKEAYFHRKPCVVLRDETEWTELIDCGANVLVSASAEMIEQSINHFEFNNVPSDIYGSGKSSVEIVENL